MKIIAVFSAFLPCTKSPFIVENSRKMPVETQYLGSFRQNNNSRAKAASALLPGGDMLYCLRGLPAMSTERAPTNIPAKTADG